MEISQTGIDLIKEFESCSLVPYKDVVGVWTIGYGHTRGVNSKTKPITKEKAEELLRNDISEFEAYVNNKQYVPQNLNQNQFDALVSFAFNLGPRNLKELCTANFEPGEKTVNDIANEITLYNKAGGKVCNGLVNRRKKEKELFKK